MPIFSIILHFIKKYSALTLVFGTAAARADIYSESVNGSKYNVKADKFLPNDADCSVNGLVNSYANIAFVGNLLPSEKKPDLKSVRYDRASKKLKLQMKKSCEMLCTESESGNSSSIRCRFDQPPQGLNYLWFKLTRVRGNESCLETIESEGQVSGLAFIKGISPESVHREVATALLSPYRGEVTHGGKLASHRLAGP